VAVGGAGDGGMKEVIIRKYKDEDDWIETTIEECIDHTEGNGYWKKDTVKDMLSNGQIVWTPFAYYKSKNCLTCKHEYKGEQFIKPIACNECYTYSNWKSKEVEG
jgi:protein-arginine kinase activator protein McsA